jgi:hypothetical protein
MIELLFIAFCIVALAALWVPDQGTHYPTAPSASSEWVEAQTIAQGTFLSAPGS